MYSPTVSTHVLTYCQYACTHLLSVRMYSPTDWCPEIVFLAFFTGVLDVKSATISGSTLTVDLFADGRAGLAVSTTGTSIVWSAALVEFFDFLPFLAVLDKFALTVATFYNFLQSSTYASVASFPVIVSGCTFSCSTAIIVLRLFFRLVEAVFSMSGLGTLWRVFFSCKLWSVFVQCEICHVGCMRLVQKQKVWH